MKTKPILLLLATSFAGVASAEDETLTVVGEAPDAAAVIIPPCP